jgi:hypothetical protein
MRHLVERVSAGTWAAYGQARALRATKGDWPTAATLHRLAEAEGGDGWALLVLTRGELPGRGDRDARQRREHELPGTLEPIFRQGQLWTRPLVVVPSCQALWACALSEANLYAYLYDPWDREIRMRDLEQAARDWQELIDRGPAEHSSVIPPVLQIEAP